MKKLFSALLVAVLLSFNLAAADLAAIDGLYEEVDPIQPTADAKRVEVLEVFWYACGVCNNFRPYMAQYELTKPAHVNLVRMPAVMGPEQRAHAQVFYAAAALNALEKTHQATYDAIHTDKKRMADAAEIKEVFTKAGADTSTFDKHFKSFGVDTQVRRAAQLTDDYGVMGTPSIIINGRYLTSPSQTGSFEKMMEVVEALVEAERQRLAL